VRVPLADVDGVTVGRGARMASAMMRADVSVEPPGGNGEISVMGRDG